MKQYRYDNPEKFGKKREKKFPSHHNSSPRWPRDPRDILALTPEEHSSRTMACIAWMKRSGKSVIDFRMYHAMTPREVSVALNQELWPKDWPK